MHPFAPKEWRAVQATALLVVPLIPVIVVYRVMRRCVERWTR